MKNFTLTLAFAVMTFFASAADVSLRFVYKSSPLCHWDVTIKQGNATVAKGVTDSDGRLTLSGVTLITKELNAEGIKKTPNGEKKWSVNGYITLDDNNYCEFDFEPVVKEAAKDSGMPASMFEGSWGLTINDCGGHSADRPQSQTTSVGSQSAEIKTGGVTANVQVSNPKQDEKQNIENDITFTSSKLHKKTLELNEADDELDIRVLEAEVDEYEARLVMLQLELRIVNKELAGEEVPMLMLQERGIRKAEYDQMRDERKAIEDEVKAARKAEKKENRGSGVKITKVKAQIKVKERQIVEEEKSFAPSENKLKLLREELEELQKELAELEG